MNRFTTVEDCEREIEVRHSRFIAIARRVRDEEELFNALSLIRKTHSAATHVCYAAVIDEMQARFSDDGEPSGTAGQPILDAIKNADKNQTLVAVVRYFGGIKLGTGGLCRAYSEAASLALSAAPIIECILSDIYSLTLDFSRAKRFAAFASSRYTILSTEYSDVVKITFALDKGNDPTAEISDVLSAKPDLTPLETRFIERPKVEFGR